MFYRFMKWYLRWMVKLHFRRIYVAGTDSIPDGHPAIFASNHPSGFMEPIILATSARQPIHFLVLGSYLRSKWLQWFFRGVKMVPIYRQDITGNQTVEKNRATFAFVHDALKQNAHILIYPEAQTHFIYKTRPLRKGIVRMAYGFLKEKTHEAMFIVPVGVNFIWPSRFRSDVFLQVGEPIRLDETEGEEQNWYREKLAMIFRGMQKVMFDVRDETRHPAVQQLVQLFHNSRVKEPESMVRTVRRAEKYVQEVRDFVGRLNDLSDGEFAALKSELQSYTTHLKEKGLNDRVVRERFLLGPREIILLLLGWPFFLLGAMLNGFSLFAGWWVKRNLVKKLEYKASVSAAVPAVLTLIMVMLSLILGFFIHPAVWLFALGLPLSMYLFIYYLDLLELLFLKWKWHRISRKERTGLLEKRSRILADL
jgi:1-acyl-sn-glycerol-3-phosphate acyltransferase